MDSEQWEREATYAALKIIPMLNGIPLNQARYALRIVETLLFQTHSVDVNNAKLTAFVKEYDLALLK
jgi:hypothetical protein